MKSHLTNSLKSFLRDKFMPPRPFALSVCACVRVCVVCVVCVCAVCVLCVCCVCVVCVYVYVCVSTEVHYLILILAE